MPERRRRRGSPRLGSEQSCTAGCRRCAGRSTSATSTPAPTASEEWEVAALANPVYDVQRLGIFFTATPATPTSCSSPGSGTAGMAGPLQPTFDAMPDPKVVVAAGTDAISGGLVHPTYATGPGIGSIVPVDVWVPGSPPSPFSLLHGILLGIGLLPEPGAAP